MKFLFSMWKAGGRRFESCPSPPNLKKSFGGSSSVGRAPFNTSGQRHKELLIKSKCGSYIKRQFGESFKYRSFLLRFL